MKTFQNGLAVFLIAAQFCGCASRPQISHSLAAVSAQSNQDEIALGAKIHEFIISKIPVYDHPEINDYVTGIGRSMVSHVKRKDLPYRFIILKDDRIYATSAPGGFIYITTGFLLFIQNEAELSAVLAHEIGELQMKDRRLSRLNDYMEKTLAAGAMVAPAFGTIGALGLLGLFGVYAVSGRVDSQEKRIYKADKTALIIMTQANEDPQGLVEILRRILYAGPRDLMYLYDYMQSRPVTSERIEKTERFFSALSLEQRSFDTRRDHFLEEMQPIKFSSTH